jgi:hypothetical protein
MFKGAVLAQEKEKAHRPTKQDKDNDLRTLGVVLFWHVDAERRGESQEPPSNSLFMLLAVQDTRFWYPQPHEEQV